MSVAFITALIAGLLIGVRAIFVGVERNPPSVAAIPGEAPFPPAPTRLRAPVVAAFLIVAGMVGYALLRTTSLGSVTIVIIAALLGGGAATGAALGIARWAIPSAREDVVDERYTLMGQLATVVTPITSQGGQIAFEVDGTRHAREARAVDGASLAEGTDVVIERVEDGVAYVEAWQQVEQRI